MGTTVGVSVPARTYDARQLLRLVLFAAATWLATAIGFATYDASVKVSLIWPVAGVGMLWLTTSTRRTWPTDVVLLSVSMFTALLASGSTVVQGVVAALLALVQPAIYLAVMRRWAPDLWGSGGTRPLTRMRDLGVFVTAALLSSLVAAALRATGLGLIPSIGGIGFAMGWVRNFGWLVSVGALGLLIGPLVAGASKARARDVLWREGAWQSRLGEALFIFLATGGLYAFLFSLRDPLPITFLLTLATVWAGARLTPVVATVHAVASGTVAVAMTLAGTGVFSAIRDPRVSAALAQGLLVTLVITTLILALTSAERAAAIERALASEHAAAERADMLTGVMESMREGLVVVEDDGTIMVRNPAGRRLIGFQDVEPAMRVLRTEEYGFVGPDGGVLADDQMPAALFFAGHEVIGRDYLIRTPRDPQGRILEMTVTRLPDAAASGRRRAIINFRDVTQERQDRDSLASFAGVVAHDLNNPLSIVTGWAESLAEAFTEGPVDPSDGTPMVARIQTAAAHMRQFIDDLLAFTIARDHPLRIEDVDLSGIAEGIATMRREGDTRPRITVQPGMWVRADAAMMRQLFDNLIGNAAKYVGPGVRPRIEISAEPLDDTLVVSVSDNGIGVPPEMRERVFDNFQRAHTGEYAGTGIGLAICRSVVERHGGHIRVEDNPSGVGSRFVLTLPLPPDVS